MTRLIYEYVSPDLNTPVSNFISVLDRETQEDILDQLEQVKLCDCKNLPSLIANVCYEEYKYLYELRMLVGIVGVGILFCYDAFDNVILLHAFYKYQELPSKRALSIARRHRSDITQRGAHTILFSIN